MGGQIDLPFGAIVEAQPQAVCAAVLHSLDVEHVSSSCDPERARHERTVT
jgi:hypothetical protein